MSRNILKNGFYAALFTAAGLTLTSCQKEEKFQSGPVTVVSGKAAIGGDYTLVDHTGKAVTQDDYLGKAQLIYFGFAFCPDVCPTALQQLGAALHLAGNAADHYQPIFITIDAERDTPEKMALYITANGFPKNLIGLSGTEEQIKHAKKVFAVYGQKVNDPSSAAGFTYDHSSLIYLMDAKGEFVDLFTHDDSPQKIADRLIAYKKTGH